MNKQIVSKFFDIRNIEDIEIKFSIKIIFQQFLLLVSFISFILLVVLSYTNGNQDFELKFLPVNVRLARAIFPVFLTWYVFASLWSIKSGLEFLRADCKLIGWLNIFSFIPVFSVYLLFYFLIKANKNSIQHYKTLLFTKDEILAEKYKWGTWRRNLVLALWIILSPVCFFFFFQETTELINVHLNNLWFSSFNFFTIQTNAMIFIFTTILLLFPSLKIFKNNNLQITVTTYIFIVGFAWNAILLPTDISSGKVNELTTYDWVSTSWYHIVNPIVFVLVSLILIFKQPFKVATSFINIFKIGLVYPLMYLVFVAIIPFTAGISIYGTFTNPNPLLMNESGSSYGNSIYFLLIIGFLFIFLIIIWILWFLDYRINLKKISNKNI